MGRVLGFVGWPCAGKDEAAEYLQSVHEAVRFGHSDFIRRLAAEQGNWSPQTQQLSALFEAQAAQHGYGWIAKQVSEAVIELWTREPRRLVVVSGVRNLAEVEVYRELSGFELVKLKADFEVRYQRWANRKRDGEGQDLSREALCAIEALPGNANIPDLIQIDGPVIINNGHNKRDFHLALDQLIHQGGGV